MLCRGAWYGQIFKTKDSDSDAKKSVIGDIPVLFDELSLRIRFTEKNCHLHHYLEAA